MQSKEEKSKYKKEWRIRNKDKMKSYMFDYYRKNSERIKAYNTLRRNLHLKEIKDRIYLKKYGISFTEKLELLKIQDNKCALCFKEFKDLKDACVDHSHTNGKVRGILCHSCNRGLGLLKDDVELLQRMIIYISKNR